ncbi:PilZ domain-containing protein [Aureimonas psammosilenae]|uniref:PilZ domain-containing protein n=1 Tax=Aureimonas psammosilenae TaxID=2495496 RepID=UPI00126126FA|nr:PilZ domain-containing protein [Aureimonas psammosilenae]
MRSNRQAGPVIDWRKFFTSPSRSPLAERRRERRNRTRLRPGKVVGEDQRFLADCTILDRSSNGLRVRCFGPIENGDDKVAVFDENEGILLSGRIAWSRDSEIGIDVEGDGKPADDATRRRLSGPYYAVGD